jgi:hypothetical protein
MKVTRKHLEYEDGKILELQGSIDNLKNAVQYIIEEIFEANA